MKTIKNLILVAFAATSIIACQKEMADKNDFAPKGEIVTFSGSVASTQTKTAIHYADGVNEFPTLFTTADVIAVNGVKSKANILNDESREYEYKEGVSVNKDQKSITFDVEGVTHPYYAVTGCHDKGFVDGVYNIQVSGTTVMQKFRTVAGGEYVSFHSSSDILAAYSETESFEFKHLTTFYAITIDSDESTVKDNIKNIYIRQGDGSNIAGPWVLKFDEDKTPYLEPGKLTAFIGYDCGDAGVAQGTTMIVGFPAYNYESGLIFTIKDVKGKFASYMVSGAKTNHAADGGKIIPFNPAFKPGDGVINSAADWNEFAAFVNNTNEKKDWEIYRWIGAGGTTIKLGKDIEAEDLDPITVDFTYTLDGNGKTITRTNATGALFSTVSGEVKNLTLAGTLTLTDEGAPLVNTLADGGKITACTNKMAVTFEADDHAYVGGLVKIMQGGTVEGCTNEGNITVNLDISGDHKNTAVAGIVAQINASTNDVTVKNSLNKGVVTLAPKSSGKGMKVCGLGGVVGWVRTAGAISLDDCDNEGEVTLSAANISSVTGMAAYAICAGGIIGIGAPHSTSGYVATPTETNGFEISMSNCDNTGVVYNCGVVYLGVTEDGNTTKRQTNKRVFTGGLAGSLLGKAADYASLVSCTNTGEVYTYDLTGTSASSQPCYSSVTGGFIGFGGYLDMDDCTVNCTMGNGKRPVMSYGGVIGCAVRPFNLKNSDVFVTGFYQRISNYQGNRAVVAAVPVLFGTSVSNTMNIAPAIEGSTITDCNIGASVKTSSSALSTANGEKTDDCSGSLTTTIFDSASKTEDNLVCGQGYTTVETDVKVTGYTYWTGE